MLVDCLSNWQLPEISKTTARKVVLFFASHKKLLLIFLKTVSWLFNSCSLNCYLEPDLVAFEMDFSAQYLEVLIEHAADETWGPGQSYRLLQQFSNILNTAQLNPSTIGASFLKTLSGGQYDWWLFWFPDFYLQHIFDRKYGLTVFVSSTMHRQAFKNAIVEALNILYTLLNNFPQQIAERICLIHSICLGLVRSLQVSTVEKTKALDLLILAFDKNITIVDDLDHYLEIYNSLMSSISIKKTDTGKLFK